MAREFTLQLSDRPSKPFGIRLARTLRLLSFKQMYAAVHLLTLTKAKYTGVQSGVCGPLVFMYQLGITIDFHQKPKQGEGMSISDMKRSVESYVATVCKSGGMFTLPGGYWSNHCYLCYHD